MRDGFGYTQCCQLMSEKPDTTITARLEILSGPLAGKLIELTGESLTIGREPTNSLPVRDGSISRFHCRIERVGNQYRVVDLDSRNGTFVNGAPAKEHVLQHADQLKVGKSVLLFRCAQVREREEAAPGAREAMPSFGDATVVLRREDSVYLRPHAAPALPANERTVRDLDTLVNFSRNLSSIHKLDDLRRSIVESLLEVAPADRVAIVIAEDETWDGAPVFGWERGAKADAPFAISRTIASKVFDEGVSVLSADVVNDSELNTAASLVEERVRSVAAVPLEGRGGIIGLLYLDRAGAGGGFDADLVQLLAAFGNIAALCIENVRHFEWLEGENLRLREELNVQHDMVGDSPAMQDVFQFISRVAPRDVTALISGESGTGKELVARALHRNSKRADRPFVAINCGAIAETLLESELFGYEKGAFTGAMAQRKGKFEIADGGTVFLDEIGELAPSLQVKLLRVLQEREFERVGGTRTVKVDIRLIAATNRDLKAESRAGRFREDLFYRLNVVSVRMPALRERRDDVPLLASHFAVRAAQRMGRAVAGISPKARACLIKYDWPGNVRELENAIERAVVLGTSDLILPEDLPESVVDQAAADEPAVSPLHEAVLDYKRRLIVNAIDQAGGNYTEAAKALGVHPNHFFRLIRTLNLKPKRQRD